jgi:hypothetical protein
VGVGALCATFPARTATLFAGVLSPESARLICHRAGAEFFRSRRRRLWLPQQASHDLVPPQPGRLDCISTVWNLNSPEGSTLGTYMRLNSMRQVDPLS